MFAIDIPTSALLGFALADAGKGMLKPQEKQKTNFMRAVVLLFNVFFFTPVPIMYLIAWPGWQTNYVMPWVDHSLNNPLSAALVVFFFVITILPAYMTFELGRFWITKNRVNLVRVGYIAFALAIVLIIYLTRNATLNIATTYANFYAGKTYPLWHLPFIACLLVTTTYSWTGFGLVCRWLSRLPRRQDKVVCANANELPGNPSTRFAS